MKHVLTTSDGIKFLITDEEKLAVIDRLNKKIKFVVLQGELISLTLPPTILTFGRWYVQESEKLKKKNMVMCKKCLCTRHVSETCACWEMNGSKKQHAFYDVKEKNLLGD